MSKDMAFDESEKRAAEWIVIIDDEIYTSLPPVIRQAFKSASIHYPDEHRYLMDNDPLYHAVYSQKRKNNKQLEEIKYNHREKKRNA